MSGEARCHALRHRLKPRAPRLLLERARQLAALPLERRAELPELRDGRRELAANLELARALRAGLLGIVTDVGKAKLILEANEKEVVQADGTVKLVREGPTPAETPEPTHAPSTARPSLAPTPAPPRTTPTHTSVTIPQ